MSNVLIAYFSWGGNTCDIAEEIQSQTGADLFEIKTEAPYPQEYNAVLKQSKQEKSGDARPTLIGEVSDMGKYDIVILGFPNWCSTIPMPVATFLEMYDLSDKTILPFCSNGGGGLGHSVSDITKIIPQSNVSNALSVYYGGGRRLPDEVGDWLSGNGII